MIFFYFCGLVVEEWAAIFAFFPHAAGDCALKFGLDLREETRQVDVDGIIDDESRTTRRRHWT